MLDDNKQDAEQVLKYQIERDEFGCYLPESTDMAVWSESSIKDFNPVNRRPNIEPSGGMNKQRSLSRNWRIPSNSLTCNQ